jgi:hypothetical protein
VTEIAEEVVLYHNGTRKYVNQEKDDVETSVNYSMEKFSKEHAATFLLKSAKVAIGVRLDPKE